MNHLNSIILEGNVVRQAELSEPSKGFKVCKFPLAVNRFLKSDDGNGTEEVSFFDIEAYGKVAEYCEKYTTKGRGVRVVGRLKQNRWKDSEGKNFSKVFVVAEHLEYKPNFKKDDSQKEDDASSQESSNEKEKELTVF
ncbi:MAG: single-stranded DNA-binding protein [Treponema sp.]|nr:single-stranded DNA-binding protein [Treponema sp.]